MWQTHFAQGNAAFQNSDFNTAYKQFTKALSLEPNNAVILDCRAATSTKMGNHKDALQDARSIVKSEPAQARGYMRMYKVLNAMNQKDKAQQILSVGLKRVPNTDSLYNSMKRQKTSKDIVTPSRNFWALLPSELMWSIFSILSLEDMVLCMRVCKHWHRFIKDTPALWRDLTISDSNRQIGTEAFIAYLKLAGTLGVHTVALGKVSGKKLNTYRAVRAILKQNACRLRHLEMTDWKIQPEDVSFLLKKTQTTLRHLTITDGRSKYTIFPTVIQECEFLEYLEISDVQLASSMIQVLPIRESLKTLRITVWPVTPEPIGQMLRLFPCLENLYLQRLNGPLPESIAALILLLPHIKELRVALSMSNLATPLPLSADQTAQLERHSSNIRVLSITSSYISELEMIPIMNGCSSSLLTLTLSQLQSSDQFIQHVSTLTLPRLQNLEIDHVISIGSNALVSLIKSCPNLKHVVLTQLPATNDDVLQALAECKHLSHVDVSFSGNLTGVGIRAIVSRLPSLTRLVADGCSNIDLYSLQTALSALGESRCSFRTKR